MGGGATGCGKKKLGLGDRKRKKKRIGKSVSNEVEGGGEEGKNTIPGGTPACQQNVICKKKKQKRNAKNRGEMVEVGGEGGKRFVKPAGKEKRGQNGPLGDTLGEGKKGGALTA